MSSNHITYLENSDVDRDKALLLADASIQAYNAFDKDHPAQYSGNIVPHEGYDFVECWTTRFKIIRPFYLTLSMPPMAFTREHLNMITARKWNQ
ncbi:MAG: hypothetical protein AB4042_16780 [Leptolyngbyaceae cyanobacterium]